MMKVIMKVINVPVCFIMKKNGQLFRLKNKSTIFRAEAKLPPLFSCGFSIKVALAFGNAGSSGERNTKKPELPGEKHGYPNDQVWDILFVIS